MYTYIQIFTIVIYSCIHICILIDPPRLCFTVVLQLRGAVQDWHHVILEPKGENVGNRRWGL